LTAVGSALHKPFAKEKRGCYAQKTQFGAECPFSLLFACKVFSKIVFLYIKEAFTDGRNKS
jgi:hypothetical protein